MKTVLKGLAILAGLVLVLIVAAAVTIYAKSGRMLARTSGVAVSPITLPTDPASLARGRHLVEAVVKCQDCHGADLGGAMFIDDPTFARLPAPNLTRGSGGVGAAYSDAEIARVLRHGIKRNAQLAVIMPSDVYQYLSDADLAAVIAYLRSVPAVDRQMPAPAFGPVFRALLVAGFPAFPADHIDHSRSRAMTVQKDSVLAVGKYLAFVGGCRYCHNPWFSGGKIATADPKSPPAANLTRGGTAGWSEADFAKVLRTGQRPGGGGAIDDRFMPWKRSGLMTDAEIHAVWLYLQSLPSKEFGEL